MKTLFICEKGSAAKALAPHLGPSDIVLAASGHLVEPKEPDEIREEWGSPWRMAQLPMIMDELPLKIGRDRDGKSHKDRLQQFGEALKKVDRVVVATDPGREGSLIAWNIFYKWFGWKGRVDRLKLGATDPGSIAKAFEEMKADPSSGDRDYAAFREAECRQYDDWHLGMNGTRLVCLVVRPEEIRDPWTFGGVQTPTLALLAQHEEKIRRHVPQDFYKVVMTVQAADGAVLELVHDPDARNRIFDRQIAEAIRAAAAAWQGPISVEQGTVSRSAPKLHSKDSLAKKAAKEFGWSPDKTLEVQQKLYDKGFLTYPRTESRYLPESQMGDAAAVLAAIASALPALAPLVPKDPVFRRGEKGTYVKEVGEHNAVCPTKQAPDLGALSPDERQLYEYVARCFLAAHMPDAIDSRTSVTATVNVPGLQPAARVFVATGTVEKSPGWRLALRDDDDEQVPGKAREARTTGKVALVANGTAGRATGAELGVSQTKPPPRITLGELPEAMGRLVDQIDNPMLKKALYNPANPREPKGLGTAATRDTIAPKLLKPHYIDLVGVSWSLKGSKIDLGAAKKDPPIQVLEVGLGFMAGVKAIYPVYADPVSRAQMEAELAEVGQASAREEADRRAAAFMARTRERLQQLVDAARSASRIELSRSAMSKAGLGKPSDAMRKLVEDICERKGIPKPSCYRTDATVCREFLDEHMPKREGNGPSEKQLALAEKVAAAAGVPLPEAARTDHKACSAFIEAHKASLPANSPSEAMLKLARKVAGEKGISLPAEVEGSFDACKKFLDENAGKPGGGKGGGGRRK